MKTGRILTYAETAGKLNWRDAVEALRQGHMRPRAEIGDIVLGPPSARLLTRAAFIGELGYAVKVVSIVAGNAALGLPTVQGTVLLYTPDTGALRAVIDAQLITEYKTAGDSVLGAQLLARPDSRHLVIVGAGVMAACLARAYSAIFPTLERISVWARRPEQARALVAQLELPKIALAATADLQVALADADIVSAATLAREPVLSGDWIRPGTHVDLVGAYLPDMREADDQLMAAASVFVDSRDTTRHIGEIIQPIISQAVRPDYVRGDLYDLLAAAGSLRASAEETTVFKNGGGAHLDLMIAAYVAEVAEGH